MHICLLRWDSALKAGGWGMGDGGWKGYTSGLQSPVAGSVVDKDAV